MSKTNVSAKILFISAPFGSGHIRAAEAVMKVLSSQTSVSCKLVNVFDFFNPYIGKIILKSYLKILEIYPQAYGLMYGWGNSSRIAIWGRELINSYLAKKMFHYISSYNPDMIVCTHATPAGLVARLSKQKLIHMPSLGIITDYVIHRWWVYPELHFYCVAHEEMRNHLAEYGIEHSKTLVTGIPIDLSFTKKYDRTPLFKKIKLTDNKFTVLIMGGGAGVLPMDEILAVCDELYHQVQFIVVTGNNKKMHDKIENMKGHLKSTVRVFGFVNNIDELMSSSDVLVTKPGGMTSAEALAACLPMLIYRPIPGQEEENTKFLVERNIAFRCDNIKEVKNALYNFVHDKELLDCYKRQAGQWAKPDSASVISEFIIQHFQ